MSIRLLSLVRMARRYVQRLGRWTVILLQVRGVSATDQAKLILSAAASPVTSLPQLGRWQDPQLLFDTRVHVRGIGEFWLRARTDDLWHVLPWRERSVHRLLRVHLTEGSVFVDAGANVGVYSVLASRLVGRSGSVLAIEMMPSTAAILRRHLGLNRCSNVELVQKALSERADQVCAARVPSGKWGQASVVVPHVRDDMEECQVQTTTLDLVCAGRRHVDLIKMDLEGAELLAMKGATDVLARTGAVVYETRFNAEDQDPLTPLLESRGFVTSALDSNSRFAARREKCPSCGSASSQPQR